jgi:hypothetical protein
MLIVLSLVAAGVAALRGAQVASEGERAEFRAQSVQAAGLVLCAAVFADALSQLIYWLSTPQAVDTIFCRAQTFDLHPFLAATAAGTCLLSIIAGVRSAQRAPDGRAALRRGLGWPLLMVMSGTAYQLLFELPRCGDFGGLQTAIAAALAIPYALVAGAALLSTVGRASVGTS